MTSTQMELQFHPVSSFKSTFQTMSYLHMKHPVNFTVKNTTFGVNKSKFNDEIMLKIETDSKLQDIMRKISNEAEVITKTKVKELKLDTIYSKISDKTTIYLITEDNKLSGFEGSIQKKAERLTKEQLLKLYNKFGGVVTVKFNLSKEEKKDFYVLKSTIDSIKITKAYEYDPNDDVDL